MIPEGDRLPAGGLGGLRQFDDLPRVAVGAKGNHFDAVVHDDLLAG